MSCEPSSSKHTSHHHLHFHHRRQHHISYDDNDLSMLLDPAYTRQRSTSSQTRVYKDHHGDIHDPDYRHFPSTPSPSTTSGGRRSKRVNSGSSSIARPSWELGLGSGLDEEEFEAYYNDGEDLDEPQHYSPKRTQTRSHYPRYSSTPSSSYTSYSPPSTSSSATSSPSSFTTTLSDTDLSYYPSTTTSSPTSSSCSTHKLTKRLLSRNSHTQRSSFVEEHVHPYEVDNVWEDSEETMSLPEERDRELTSSPTESGVTASEAMRKQWQATKLSVRFGVFRAQRRVKEALAGKR